MYPTPTVKTRQGLPCCMWSVLLVSVALAGTCRAVETPPPPASEDFNAHFQSTYIWQKHPGFDADYSGDNSLTPGRDKSYTFTATAFLGFRPWRDGELYLNGELVQGVPFTGSLVGVGTSPNGEVTRTAGATIKGYIPRFFLRQTWNLGGERQVQESAANQLQGKVDADRFVLTAGKFSVLDIFDNNTYAKDSRSQFMNAANMGHAAFDYASDARGYGWGLAGEWYRGDWVFRLGRMSGPLEPNGPWADTKLLRHYGDQFEVERSHSLAGQPGKARLLVWRDRAQLARFRDALAYGNAAGWAPDPVVGRQYIFKVRGAEQRKYGVGINLEQAVSATGGVFLRAMWADGATETWAFTEADRSLALGWSGTGGAWSRTKDNLGVSAMVNTLSADRRAYLAAGGISYFIGDGALNYRPEQLLETYYSLSLGGNHSLTLDYQRILHPAYNAGRGPVNVLGARLHLEY